MPYPTSFKLDYIFVPGQPFSLAIEDSDYTYNQVLLDPLVGTLVKYGPTGHAEPYLATSWTANPDKTKYVFTLRNDLSCSDGYPLTATNFAQGLFERLKRYAQQSGDALEFQKLLGWSNIEMASAPTDIGITPDDSKNELAFKFHSSPHDLMNLLRMPYFGFYSPANFGPLGRSRGKFELVSCGPFEVVTASDSHIRLRKRDKWFTSSTTQLSEINFRRESTIPSSRPNTPTIVDSSDVAGSDEIEGYQKVFGPPMILYSLILNSKFSMFHSAANRHWVASQVGQHRLDFVEGLSGMISANSLMTYPQQKVVIDGLPKWPATSITAYITRNVSASFRSRVENLLTSLFRGQGIEVEFPALDLNEHAVTNALLNNRLVDLRVSGVSIGDHFHPSAFRMMFCSNMGVGFPDPDGAICKIIDEYESAEKHDIDVYGQKIGDQIERDAAVIPLARKALGWLYSHQIDRKSIMPIPNYPRFELLKFE